eukprot:Selendium_serpulae@DN5159_c0_g1_i1.p2
MAAVLEMKEFASGFFEPDVLDLALDDIEALVGKWEVIAARSESHDAILAALGVPYLKRAVMKNSTPVTEISTGENDVGKPYLKLVSHLPMKITKTAFILLDGSPCEIDDGDTGKWICRAMVKDGVLYQRRENKKTGGVMFDSRCVVSKDPAGKCDTTPMMVFKWAFFDKNGKEVKCHRFMKKK